MTLREMQELREKTENMILKALKNFEEETSLSITDVALSQVVELNRVSKVVGFSINVRL